METAFNYNDEVHTVVAGNAGQPVAVFSSKKKAELFAKERIVENFLMGWGGEQLGSFGWEVKDVFRYQPKCLEKMSIFFERELWDLEDVLDFQVMSRKELEQIADALSIRPYTVVQVK